MTSLFDRYLDGELTDDEARDFLDSLSEDPELEAQMAAHERALSLIASAGFEGPPDDLADEIMNKVRRAQGSSSGRTRGVMGYRWVSHLAWAAGLIMAFGLGLITARTGVLPVNGLRERSVQGVATPSADGSAGSVERSMESESLRLVRLVYTPESAGIDEVSVAGDFNDWNPDALVMKRYGNTFVARLFLPRGTYEYMFVENGDRWVTDPLAAQTVDDGFGKKNAVLDLRL